MHLPSRCSCSSLSPPGKQPVSRYGDISTHLYATPARSRGRSRQYPPASFSTPIRARKICSQPPTENSFCKISCTGYWLPAHTYGSRLRVQGSSHRQGPRPTPRLPDLCTYSACSGHDAVSILPEPPPEPTEAPQDKDEYPRLCATPLFTSCCPSQREPHKGVRSEPVWATAGVGFLRTGFPATQLP